MSARIRCAIYTRKSSEEGLEQAFNSLDAQREACLAFIKSQQGMGWVALPAAYEDGGLSGGTLERPALQRLLADIANRRVDLVVVYKVDRLTRSLADFAKIVEVFDANAVSFVSVTQQFNTTTSMGRLTLNMLLSFAQFEREVTGERIRDKIAASKRKGMWTGGPVPLGYEVRDKRLVINKTEAATVRALFRLYLKLGTVQRLVEHARRRGLVTKQRTNGGGQTFSRGHLYQLLSNPLYVGDIVHGGQRNPGQHEAIVERRMFDAVRRQLERNSTERQSQTNAKAPSLLSGLVFDEQGDRLSPTHASKQGRRYRYYISRRLMHGGKDETGWRLPARELEQALIGTLAAFLRNEARLVEALSLNAAPGVLRQNFLRAKSIAADLEDDQNLDRRHLLQRFVGRVIVHADSLQVDLRRATLNQMIGGDASADPETDAAFVVHAPMQFARRGVEAKLILGGVASATPDQTLIAVVAQAHRWLAQLISGEVGSIDQIAARERVDASDVGRQIRLAFLAPDIVEAVLAGTQPVELTAKRLKRMGNLPPDWEGQRRMLGFST